MTPTVQCANAQTRLRRLLQDGTSRGGAAKGTRSKFTIEMVQKHQPVTPRPASTQGAHWERQQESRSRRWTGRAGGKAWLGTAECGERVGSRMPEEPQRLGEAGVQLRARSSGRTVLGGGGLAGSYPMPTP